MKAAADALKVHSLYLEIRAMKDIAPVFRDAVKERLEALLVLANPAIIYERAQFTGLAMKNRLPTVYSQPEFVNAGGLFSYAANFTDLFRRTATYVDKILKGAKPANLPVEQPRKFEFIVNLKTAKQLGLTVPPNVLARADEVIR